MKNLLLILSMSVKFVFTDEIALDKRNRNFNNVNRSRENHSFDPENEKSAFVPMQREILWFINMPSLPLLITNANSLPDGDCKKKLNLYHESLKNGTLWAVQMFDSSVKNIYGTIDGHTRHLGSFDQCYRIGMGDISNEENSKEIRGRYCLVDIKYKQKQEPREISDEKLGFDFDPNGSAWEAIREKGDFRRVKRYMLQLALCVPSDCDSADIETTLSKPLKKFGNGANLDISVSVEKSNCHAFQEETSFSIAGIIFCIFILVLIAIVVFGTWYDSKEYNYLSCDISELMLCFSASRNLDEIFTVNYRHRGLDTIHTLRVLCMGVIIGGHGLMQYYYNSVINERRYELTFGKRILMICHNATILTDGFLGISGLLMSYNLLRELDSQKKLSFFKKVFVRYIRLTPVYLLITLFNALILPHIGNGPNWKRLITELYGNYCTNNWWSNIFYISNYINAKQMCMFQSYFLAANFQCSVLALLLIYAFWLMPRKAGYTFMALVLFLSGIPSFYMSYVHNAEPFMQAYPYLRVITESSYYYDYYIKTHMRITPYLVGLIVGVFIYDYNFASWRLSKIWSRTLIILLGPVMGIYVEILGFKFMDPNIKASPLETAIYASTHRGLFAFSLCSIVLFLTIGDGLNLCYRVLNAGWMQPLSNLTFCAFLVHTVIQSYRMATARVPRTFSFNNFVLWEVLPDLIWTFFISTIIAILVEVPFRKIEKRILFKRQIDMKLVGSKVIDSRKTD